MGAGFSGAQVFSRGLPGTSVMGFSLLAGPCPQNRPRCSLPELPPAPVALTSLTSGSPVTGAGPQLCSISYLDHHCLHLLGIICVASLLGSLCGLSLGSVDFTFCYLHLPFPRHRRATYVLSPPRKTRPQCQATVSILGVASALSV